MPNLVEIIRSCHDELILFYASPEVTMLERLMGLFLKADASFDSKRFLLRHLNTFLPYANQINVDESMPLAFEVHDMQTFLLAQIYLKFLTIFDESICDDANHYLDILSASPTWHAWLTKASEQMKYNLKLYFQLSMIDERQAILANVDTPEIKNILLLSTLSMRDIVENHESYEQQVQHKKLGFEFRWMKEFPEVPFQHATVICYKSNEAEDAVWFYYPANSLRKFKISEDLLFYRENTHFITDYAIPTLRIEDNVDINTFIPEICPILVNQGENYFVYGRTEDNNYQFNKIDANIARIYFESDTQDFSELCDELHIEGFHIPFIPYQNEYPIFEYIQRILDEEPPYELRYVGEEEIPFIEERCIYVHRDAQMHTLSVSLKACSGQELLGIETGIVANENLTDDNKNAVLNYLRQDQLIPYVNATQQAILKNFDEHQIYLQNAIDNHVPATIKNIQHDGIKAFILSTIWNVLGKSGLHTQVGQVFGVFNALEMLNLGIKVHYELDIDADDMQFGRRLIAKQDWGTWLKYAGLGLLFSSMMNRFGFNINSFFTHINLLNLVDSVHALNHSFKDTNSRQFLNDTLSCGFSILLYFHFNESLMRGLMLVQAYFLYQQYQTAQVAQVVAQENVHYLSADKVNFQTKMEQYNAREQQARYLLAKMEDLLASLHRISTIADEHLIEHIEPIQSLISQYLSFVAWRQDEYQPFLINLKNQYNIGEAHRYRPLIDEELERVQFSAIEMNTRFEHFQQAVEAKKQELESTYQNQHIDIDALGWSSEWFYQPSTMISAGLLLSAASLVSMYMLEFIVVASISALMLHIMIPAFMLTTAVGIGLACYGFNQIWEPEDLSVPPIPIVP
jgi:hypothetical protein